MIKINNQKHLKIVLTGGPGGGKTTAADLLIREFNKNLTVVPESATTLFKSGIKRTDDAPKVKSIQKAIFKIQKIQEELYEELNEHDILLCDRGSLDGLAYWPGENSNFFKEMNTSFEEELNCYQSVIFFETSAKATLNFLSGNPYRIETAKKAIEIDQRLFDIWSKHPNFIFIPNQESFVNKVMVGINTIKSTIKILQPQ